MKLREIRGDRLAKEIAAAINRPGLDVSMLSRFENGRCLPTVTDMEHIERGYGATRHELYEPHELDFRPATPRKRDTHKLTRKLTVRLTDELASRFTVEVAYNLGYQTKQALVVDCIALACDAESEAPRADGWHEKIRARWNEHRTRKRSQKRLQKTL